MDQYRSAETRKTPKKMRTPRQDLLFSASKVYGQYPAPDRGALKSLLRRTSCGVCFSTNSALSGTHLVDTIWTHSDASEMLKLN
jgi:hypothetical protein